MFARYSGLVTRVRGKYYDLSSFDHPGGPVALALAGGRDATGLMASYHHFTERDVYAVLNKYEIADQTAAHTQYGIPIDDTDYSVPAFLIEFLPLAKAYVRAQPSRQFAPPHRWLIVAVIHVLWCCALYYATMHLEPLAIVLLPCLSWLASIQTFHDASHFSLASSRRWWINTLFCYVHCYFSSVWLWALQHVVGHHLSPNKSARDPDLYHSIMLQRLDRTLRSDRIWHRWQHITWPLMWVLSWAGFTFPSSRRTLKHGAYNRVVPCGTIHVAYHKWHYFGRAVVLTLWLSWPWWSQCAAAVGVAGLGLDTGSSGAEISHGWRVAYAMYVMVMYYVFFMASTQVNHLTVQAWSDGHPNFWHHQLVSSTTIASNSRWVTLWMGGLNLQSIHHLMPGVYYSHLYHLQPQLEAICEKHGIQLPRYHSWYQACCDYARLLFQLRPLPGPAQPGVSDTIAATLPMSHAAAAKVDMSQPSATLVAHNSDTSLVSRSKESKFPSAPRMYATVASPSLVDAGLIMCWVGLCCALAWTKSEFVSVGLACWMFFGCNYLSKVPFNSYWHASHAWTRTILLPGRRPKSGRG